MSLQTGVTPPAMSWARRYPQRWQREVTDLESTGWAPRFSDEGDFVYVDYPVAERSTAPRTKDSGTEATPARAGEDHHDDHNNEGADQGSSVVRLEVWFPAEYPFFPPRVVDADRALGLRRHTNGDGVLCLIDNADWRIDTTVAELLRTQMPRLLQAANAETEPGPGAEVRVAEPVGRSLARTRGGAALIMPAQAPPAHVGEGAVVVRYALRDGEFLGVGLAERILGEDTDIPGPAPFLWPAFRLVSYGRWARDPDFNRVDTPEATYERVQQRLAPLTINDHDHDHDHDDEASTGDNQAPDDDVDESAPDGRGSDAQVSLPPSSLETLCLLVPGERGYRQPGEEWVAIQRVVLDDHASCFYLRVQQLDTADASPRVPQRSVLAGRHVVVVGTGALGGHVATDLARTGVGRIDLVDGDDVEVTTAVRQYAPLFAAGRKKAEALASHLALTCPNSLIRYHTSFVGAVALTPASRGRRDRMTQALYSADLVVDAAADPAASGYLAALRQAIGRDFLHLSATAGVWGGCVFLATADTGCWACLQHHRVRGAVPVPPADPDGIINPPGCADETFTGTNPDLALVAHHASRVAIDRLTGGTGLGGDLYVAYLSDAHGAPRPCSWRAVEVPVHPACPLHTDTSAAGRDAPEPSRDARPQGAGTAPSRADRTVPQQPHEGEADGHSPPDAPIPTNQQR